MNSHAPSVFTLAAAVCLLLAMTAVGWSEGIGTTDASDSRESVDWAKARDYWAFRSPQTHPLPEVNRPDWPRRPMDYFIVAQLEAEGLEPSPQADRRTQIRRLTYALTGLPPKPEEIDAFLKDKRPQAYEILVDRLLASPQFGERVASLWLNLARYAEDQAHQVGNDTKHFYPNAHRYREWVIQAFNRDLPYDRFVRMQLAADQYETATTSDLPALGFIGLGPKYYNRGRLEVKADEWEDRVDTVSRTFLGLTVACARCHDHKYDPITTRDYHALAGVFASTRLVNRVPGTLAETDAKAEEKDKEKDQEKNNDTISPDEVHMVEDGEIQNLHVFLRGDVDRKGPLVERRFLRVLSSDTPEPFDDEKSGRKELAEAIASAQNPLTARVMVNRMWGMIFGRPLVGTPSNFGSLGDRPTHPDLLDDLSVRFMNSGWSVKELVKELVLSATFRQSSKLRSQAQAKDPANRFFWRMNPRRLSVEMWRDTVLSVSGHLEWKGGRSLELDDPKNHRRTVYGRISRLQLNEVLALFDYPDPNVHNGKRSQTITPVQKLFVLNNPFMMHHAEALAKRLTSDPHQTDTERIHTAYNLLFGRPPRGREIELALEFLGSEEQKQSETDSWEQYSQALLAANELIFID